MMKESCTLVGGEALLDVIDSGHDLLAHAPFDDLPYDARLNRGSLLR